MERHWMSSWAMVTVLALAACGEVVSNKSVMTTTVVGPAGGSIALGSLEVVLPPGAVAEETTVTVQIVAHHPGGNIGPVYEIDAGGAELLEPVTISVDLAPGDLPEGTEPAQVRLAFVQADAWLVLPGSRMDADNGIVSGQTMHFSKWGAVPPLPPVPCETAVDCPDVTCLLAACTDGGCEYASDPECGICIANCSGKECGDDGCGTSCGECTPDSHTHCNAGGNCVCTFLECGDVCCDEGENCFMPNGEGDPPDEPHCLACTAECTVGETGCQNPDNRWECITDPGGCGVLLTSECPQSKTCIEGECVDCSQMDEEACNASELTETCMVIKGWPQPQACMAWLNESQAGEALFVFCAAFNLCGHAMEWAHPADSPDELWLFQTTCLPEDWIEADEAPNCATCPPPCIPLCDGKECGDDGCGGLCGTCQSGLFCESWGGMCVSADPPQCEGKQCGPDSVGGSCGPCDEGWSCNMQGKCMPDAGDCAGIPEAGLCMSGWAVVCSGDEPKHTPCKFGGCEIDQVASCLAVPCLPDCFGRTCGDDGCGGSCGLCDSSEVCAEGGVCLPESGCGSIDNVGTCLGHLFAWCEDGTLLTDACLAKGLLCGPDECNGPPGCRPVWTDTFPCTGLPEAGHCDAGHLFFCDDGYLAVEHCLDLGYGHCKRVDFNEFACSF
jgi:hypothetical protein